MNRFWFNMHLYSGVQKSGNPLEIWKNKYNKNICSACCLSADVNKTERGQRHSETNFYFSVQLSLMLILQHVNKKID